MDETTKKELRSVLGAFATGVTVITTLDADGNPQGCTVNSFSSVSLDPPLVLWSQALTARSVTAFRNADRFVVNILAEDQAALSGLFASSKVANKFEGVNWTKGIDGLPILEGSAAVLECRKHSTYPGGDHLVYFGQVDNFKRIDRSPLVFASGQYMVTYAREMSPIKQGGEQTTNTHIDATHIAVAAIRELRVRLDECIGLAVWGNRGPTMVAWERGTAPPHGNLRVGTVMSLLNAATGCVFGAYLPREQIVAVMEREQEAARQVGEQVLSEAQINARFDDVRRMGIATTRIVTAPGYSGVESISAPVFDQHKELVYALTVLAPIGSIEKKNALQLLREVAASVSARLGFKE